MKDKLVFGLVMVAVLCVSMGSSSSRNMRLRIRSMLRRMCLCLLGNVTHQNRRSKKRDTERYFLKENQ
jgi:hypothetical protein